MSRADEKGAAESAEIRRLRVQLHGLRQADGLLEKAAAWLAQEQR